MHTCDYCGDKETRACCDMCHKAHYCNDECMKKAWDMHQMECNIHDVDEIKTTIATPYIMQDIAPSDIVKSLPESSFINHNHLIRSVNTDGTVQYTQVDSCAGLYQNGDVQNVLKLPESAPYQITFKNLTSGESGTVKGDISYDVIHPKCTNPLAARLAGIDLKGPNRVFQAGLNAKLAETIELWPNPLATTKAMAHIPINAKDTYSIQLNDEDPQQFKFYFGDDEDIKSKVTRQSRLDKFAQHMKKLQSIAGHARSDNSMVLYTRDGQRVVLDLDTSGNLVSIHFDMNDSGYHGKATPNAWGTRGLPKTVRKARTNVVSQIKMQCDSSNINHVTALTMALRDRVGEYDEMIETLKRYNTDKNNSTIREMELKNDEFKKQLKQLETYQKDLNEKGPQNDMKINALISSVMEDQYAHIGADCDVKLRWYKEIGKSGEFVRDESIRLLADWKEAYQKMIDAKKGSKDTGKGRFTRFRKGVSSKVLNLKAKKLEDKIRKWKNTLEYVRDNWSDIEPSAYNEWIEYMDIGVTSFKKDYVASEITQPKEIQREQSHWEY